MRAGGGIVSRLGIGFLGGIDGISATYPEGLPPPGRCFSGCTCRKRMELLCTGKHRVWSPKHRLVRNIPETFKGLGLPQQTAFCPQKAMLAGIMR